MSRRDHEYEATTSQRFFESPLTIGVISDTHIYTGSKRQLPDGVKRLFRRAEVGLLVHLGDINVPTILDELAEMAPVIAVVGNNDDEELQYSLPRTTRFTVGGTSFAAIHGHGGRSAREVALERWGNKVDYILFGHSHLPLIERVGTSVLFNPGSPTDRRWHPHFGVGLITVRADGVDPELVLFTNPDHLDNVAIGSETRDNEGA